MKIEALYEKYQAVRENMVALLLESFPNIESEKKVHEMVDGSIKFADAYIVAKILLESRPETILEVGSFLGFSTRWLCEVASIWGGTVTAVDPNIKHRVFNHPKKVLVQLNDKFIDDGTLEVVTGFFGPPFVERDIEWRYTKETTSNSDYVGNLVESIPVVESFGDKNFECIFIDGQHHYEAVARNFQLALKNLKSGGTCLFHDALTWDDVNRFMRELRQKHADAYVEVLNGGDVLAHPAVKDEPVRTVDGIGVFRLGHH